MSIDFEAISEIDWARLAAYTDGEGFLGIVKFKDLRTKVGYRYKIMLQITNTKFILIDWLIQTFGFLATEYKYSDSRPRNKGQYKAYLDRRKVVDIVEKIYPYLLLKQEQADLILEFHYSESTQWRMGKVVPAEVLSERERLYLAVKELNRRGVPESWL